MRRNNFTSASDRRWQRRYERIHQRREEELERRDRRGRDADERVETISAHDLGIDSLVASSPTFTITIPRTDEPNLNGTVIPDNVWDEAWIRHCKRANESRRSLSEEISSYLATDEDNAEERSRLWRRIRDAFYKEISEAYEARRIRIGEEIHEHTARDIEQGRGYRAQTMVIDDYGGLNIRFKNGEYIIIDDIAPAFEPEPELKAGDSAELDSFLGNFVAPGA